LTTVKERERVPPLGRFSASPEDVEQLIAVDIGHACLNSLFQTGLKNLLDRAVIDRANETPGLREIVRSFCKIDEIPFDFSRRRMSVVLEQSSRVKILVCTGAVEEMLDICTQLEEEGRVLPLTPERSAALKALHDQLNENGLRVVAVA
jgi:P-type Mg2+ transporter